MASWSKTTKHEPSSINGGQRYKKGDRVSREQLNLITENAFYAMDKSDEANTKSENALAVANGIDAKATESLNNSQTAVNTSNSANTKSDTAVSTANSANTTANEAKKLAEQALSTQGTNPNLLINPDFSINQRGKTEYQGNNVYCVDRWQCGENTEFNVETKTISFYTQNSIFVQHIEDYKRYAGQTVTISAKINSINTNVDISLLLQDGTGDKTKRITETGVVSYTYTLTNDITRFRAGFIYTSPTTEVARQLQVEWVKVEISSVATPFVPRPYAEELELCKRYYQKPFEITNEYLTIGMGYSYNSTKIIIFPYNFAVEMRTTPTMEYNGGFRVVPSSQYAVTNISIDRITVKAVALKFYTVDNNLTKNQPYMVGGTTDLTAYIAFDAEIY